MHTVQNAVIWNILFYNLLQTRNRPKVAGEIFGVNYDKRVGWVESSAVMVW